MDVRARWAEVVGGPEADVPLDEAALLISACAQPALDVAAQLSRLDDLAARVRRPGAAGVCEVLFGELGLRGDSESYDDPLNSYLDRVLDRRLGIPISLSVLLVEVGRRCGVALEPIGMPGHFLVRDPAAPDELIDAFHGGRRLDSDGCQQLLSSVAGDSVRLRPEMLTVTGKLAVLARMLGNLDRSFERRQDIRSLRWVSELRMHLPGIPLADRTQLAMRLGALGRFDAAADVLEDVAAAAPAEGMRQRLVHEAWSLRARLN